MISMMAAVVDGEDAPVVDGEVEPRRRNAEPAADIAGAAVSKEDAAKGLDGLGYSTILSFS